MSKIYSVQALIGNYEVEIYSIKKMIKGYEDIKDVIRKFDGKMLNVKLENAMEDVLNGIWARVKKSQYNPEYAEIVLSCKDRKSTEDEDGNVYYADIYDESGMRYLPLEGENLNRISAEKWIEKIDKHIEQLKGDLNRMIDNSRTENIKSFQDRKMKLIEEIDIFNNDLDNVNWKYFEINRH